MRDLGLDGLSDDRRYVLLRSETGERFRVPLDEQLRAASRGDRARLGPVETQMTSRDHGDSSAASAMRPRDIQARIRSGESPEAVAAVAQLSLERVMTYAGPVLAEREHVCAQARRSGLRRKHASGPGRVFGDVVDEHLRGRGLDPAASGWDSWRRDDGRWAVTVAASRQAEPATFLFDLPGRYVVAQDDAARRLVGDEPPLSVEPEPDEPATAVRALPRVVPTPAESAADPPPADAPAADDPPADAAPRTRGLDRLRRPRAARSPGEQLAFEATPEPMTEVPPATPAQAPARVPAEPLTGAVAGPVDEPVAAPLAEPDDMDALARAVGADHLAGQAASDTATPDTATPDTATPDTVVADDSDTGRQRRRKDRRRASVPSWDEIMFGSRPQR